MNCICTIYIYILFNTQLGTLGSETVLLLVLLGVHLYFAYKTVELSNSMTTADVACLKTSAQLCAGGWVTSCVWIISEHLKDLQN